MPSEGPTHLLSSPLPAPAGGPGLGAAPRILARAMLEAFRLSLSLIPLPGWALRPSVRGGSFDVFRAREGFSSLPGELRWGGERFLAQQSQLAAYLSR